MLARSDAMLANGLLCTQHSQPRVAASRALKRIVIALSARGNGRGDLLWLLQSRPHGSLLTR